MPTPTRPNYSGYALFFSIGVIVLAFMALSLAITATGTARFALAMGYSEATGYAIGAVFDLAKAVVPVGLLILFARHAYVSLFLIGTAWIGLVLYSALATHATVGLAISKIERTATWQMEKRNDTRTELVNIEKRLKALSNPTPPRPSKTVVQALASQQVPAGVWRKSKECRQISRSRYFHNVCAEVLELRAELAAAQDYERLSTRARELRATLTWSPIVATTDPLPQAFSTTIGRIIPLEGTVGIALLLTLVTEVFSCFGLATLRALRPRTSVPGVAIAGHPSPRNDRTLPRSANHSSTPVQSSQPYLHRDRIPLPNRSIGRENPQGACDIVSIRRGTHGRAKDKKTGQGSTVQMKSNVPAFARSRLKNSAGQSIAASELLAAYKHWCLSRGQQPHSQQKLGIELGRLGLVKWKSCGRIRYRDVQLVA